MAAFSSDGPFCFQVPDNRVLFVDDLYVTETKGLTRRLHQPKKHPATPVITGDLPWEDNHATLHGTVLLDPVDGLFKAWYKIGPDGCDCAYAVSKDGVEWEKPLLEIFPRGDRPTNIVYRGIDPSLLDREMFNMENVSVMIPPGEADPQRRYKMFTFQAPISKEAREEYSDKYFGHYVAYSPDGIHWSARPEPVLNKSDDDPAIGDCHTCMYDPLKDRFIAFTKQQFIEKPSGTGDFGSMARVRSISFSDDFEHWTRPQTCLVPDDQDHRCMHFYNMSGFVYEGMYLGLLEIYYSDDNHPTMPRMCDIQLISSRSGDRWWRAGGREPFLSPSGQAGQWDAYMLGCQSGGPIARGDELWFYYGGSAQHHVPQCSRYPQDEGMYAIGLSTLRRDGFVSYDAGAAGGTLTTKPVHFQKGSALHVNAEVRGQLSAEVVSIIEEHEIPLYQELWRYRTGRPIEGFTLSDCKALSGDHLDATIGWTGGDIGVFKGQLIALRFHLTDGSLYSFWIE